MFAAKFAGLGVNMDDSGFVSNPVEASAKPITTVRTAPALTRLWRQQKLKRDMDPRGPTDLVMLLPGKGLGQPVDAFAIAAVGDHHVDAVLVLLVDRVERLAAVVEIKLVRSWIGKRRGEVPLEG